MNYAINYGSNEIKLRRTFLFLFMAGLSIFLIASAASAISEPSLALLNPEFLDYQTEKMHEADPATEKITIQSFSNPVSKTPLCGICPSPVLMADSYSAFPENTTESPRSFDLRETGRVTEVRNQGRGGNCWAFASYASLESCLLPEVKMDLSENHMKNTLASSCPEGFDRSANGGGNHLISTAYLTRWSGPVPEVDDPYNQYSTVSPSGLEAVKHIHEVLFLPKRNLTAGNKMIKHALENYGAVYSSMYIKTAYLNERYSSYYYSGNGGIDLADVSLLYNETRRKA